MLSNILGIMYDYKCNRYSLLTTTVAMKEELQVTS